MKATIENAISTVMKEYKKNLQEAVDSRVRERLVDGVIDELVDKQELAVVEADNTEVLQIGRRQ